MKKIIIVAVCAFCALTASAQRASSSSSSFFSTEKADGGVQFGIRGGLNVANMTIEEDNVSVSCDAKTNWHVGVIADIPVSMFRQVSISRTRDIRSLEMSGRRQQIQCIWKSQYWLLIVTTSAMLPSCRST